ncbi:hypothetical protein, partial [Stenotrophomonas sp. SrG]|uniref:hypothetical protein n=1 Tax=Stenotrophomonas sp. SrG TaxID=3414430 RepID=UPI003CF9709E
ASGYNASATADSATAIGGSLYYEEANGNVLLDKATSASGTGATALGAGAQATGEFSTASGAGATTAGLQTSAVAYS